MAQWFYCFLMKAFSAVGMYQDIGTMSGVFEH